MNENYCIIGTGVTAVHAAKAIRDHDQEANIHGFWIRKDHCHITELNYRRNYIQI